MAFVNSFVSYLALLLLFAAVAGIAIFLGITLRKRNDAKKGQEDQAENPSMS